MKKNTKQIDKLLEETVEWEESKVDEAEKSKKNAYLVSFVFGLIAVLSLSALVMLFPLKETIPHLVRVDNATGIPDLVSRLDVVDVSYEDVQDKYWLSMYVRARESYDWHTLQKDYNTVGLLTTLESVQEYNDMFKGDNSIEKVYGKGTSIRVKILSVVPNGRGIGTIRFETTTKNNQAVRVERKVATIGYDYAKVFSLLESERLVNPFGFNVTSYRTDPEI